MCGLALLWLMCCIVPGLLYFILRQCGTVGKFFVAFRGLMLLLSKCKMWPPCRVLLISFTGKLTCKASLDLHRGVTICCLGVQYICLIY